MQSNPRILVVDDEPHIRRACSKFLKRIGFEVDEAENTVSAIAKIPQFSPHIVLLDIEMPGMPGNQLVRIIKALYPQIEVIMITGLACEKTKAACLSNGAFAVMNKPFQLEGLKLTLHKALERHGSQL